MPSTSAVPVDRLSGLLERFRVRAHLFHAGPLCGVSHFDAQEGRGFLHVLRRGEMVVTHRPRSGAPRKIKVTEPTLLLYPRPLEHQFHNAQGLALTEEHDIVYRSAAQPGDPAPTPQKPPLDGQTAWSRTVVPNDVLLFRYSALTFNGHRIHYDRKYVTEVEGYPGLIVHGPLIATLLLDLLRRELPDAQVAAFDFRAVRPTFDLHPFSVHGKPSSDGKTVELWAQDYEGWLTMQGTATLA